MLDRFPKDSRARRLALGALVYVVAAGVFALVAGDRLLEHTPYNHYAHLANAWLHGRHDLAGGPPPYAGGNDFAEFHGKTFISFPPFPAVLMLPFVALAGSPENFRDGQLVVWLAGVGPAVLFLVLEKLRRLRLSDRGEGENLVLAFLFAFGTVYFFTAVQGTVWFAAHVVGVGLCALYMLFAIDAERPVLAGAMLACMWMTRPTMLLLAPVFVVEAVRKSCPTPPGDMRAWKSAWRDVSRERFAELCLAFGVPLTVAIALMAWMNHARFGRWDPTAFGHEYLTVYWRSRIEKWGLFGYHYFPKNLGIFLTSLPFLPPKQGPNVVPFQVNTHGLALWFVTPMYLWLLAPRIKNYLYYATFGSVLIVVTMNLCYQNSGWSQFGYRFSNDYSVLLFELFAVGGRSMKSTAFAFAAVWAIAWNAFGAVSFERAAYAKYYFTDGSQQTVYQPD